MRVLLSICAFALSQAAFAANYQCVLGYNVEAQEEGVIVTQFELNSAVEDHSFALMTDGLFGVCGTSIQDDDSSLYCGMVEVEEGVEIEDPANFNIEDLESSTWRSIAIVPDQSPRFTSFTEFGGVQYWTYCQMTE